jgi:hypothetical protein
MTDESIENIYDMNIFEASDLDDLLHRLLKQIRNITNAQAGTIYLMKDDHLKFHIFQNDLKSYEEIYKIYKKIKDHKLLLNDNTYICVEAFNKSKIICVDDIYKTDDNNFLDTKKFDQLVEYKTHSMIAIPLINPSTKQKLGIIQILNKLDKNDSSKTIPFTKEDQQTVYNNSLFISISISQLIGDMEKLKNANKKLKQTIKEQTKKNLEQYKILQEQTKNISLGNLMHSIAHNWRQPLSTISTLASGMSLKLDFNKLSNDELKDGLSQIVNTTLELSNLISTFNEFYDVDDEKIFFNISQSIDKAYNIIKSSLKQSNIEVMFDMDERLSLSTYYKNFIQVILSIFILHEDIFTNKNEKNIIFIKIYQTQDKIIIDIKNNQKNINLEDFTKYTYFSSLNFKQNKPTLFMIKRIIHNSLDAKLEYTVEDFSIDNEIYKGINFKIIFEKV